MKKRLLTSIVSTAIVALFVTASSGVFAGGVHTMEGTISAVEPEHNTVVVEVPMGEGKMFTVGGPLVADAALNKDGRRADLEEYSAGDPVSVTWRETPNGHVIEKLTARSN